MATRRRGLIRMIVSMAIVASAAAGVVAAIPIEGTLAPESALSTKGSFAASGTGPDSLVVSWTPAVGSNEALVTAERALVTLREMRWQTQSAAASARSAGAAATLATGIDQDFRQLTVDDARLYVRSAEPGARSILTSTHAGPLMATLGPVATCAVASLPPAAVSTMDLTPVPIPIQAWSSPADAVIHADCVAATVSGKGPGQLVVFGSRVSLSYTDPEDHSVAEASFETGYRVTPGMDLRSPIHHTYSELIVVWSTEAAVLRASASGTVALQSAGASIEGSLRIPEGSGATQWGDAKIVDARRALEPSGQFQVSPHGRSVAFRGDASTAFQGIAFGAGLVALAAAIWKFGLPPLQGLFTRLAPDDALRHPRRRAILDYIEQHPGASSVEIAKALAWSRNSVEHHLSVLAREKLVSLRRFGARRAIFRADAVPPDEGVYQLRSPSRLAVVRALEAAPGLTQADLKAILGMSQSHLSATLAKLRAMGLVEASRHGRRLVYRSVQR